jgi:DNA-binding beta-propeller fold protein YncE
MGVLAIVTLLDFSTIKVCPVNLDGTFNTCVTATPSIGNLRGPAINNAGTNFYVASDNGNVYLCPTDPVDGNIGTCIVAGNFPNNPTAVGLNPANTFAYVGDASNFVSVCPINSNGTFGTCIVQTDSTFSQIESIAVGY